jgi:tetratricopeptide (TPR) repeat protein
VDSVLSRPLAVAFITIVLVAALIGIQAAATASAPAQPVASTGALLGNAGFAYLGGLRVFAAAVLWNRLEPQFDGFYKSTRLENLTFLMPNFYLVQKLNPTFVQAYYNAAFILAMRHQWDEAFQVAREGIANNPKSGLMRANYAQVLLLQDEKANLSEAYKQALVGVGPDMTYDSIDDEFESLAVFRGVFAQAGRKDLEATTLQRLDQLRAQGAQGSAFGAATGGN